MITILTAYVERVISSNSTFKVNLYWLKGIFFKIKSQIVAYSLTALV